ncbi:hypothetical protein CIB84_016155 [Bambusicola thoracicus]|uniref:Uncharacterized protein n=1 Tax=Bambusicola thoracicus TaxID=9083 RepID=A0A2P4S4F3_BAMTH|nr:hypothetical protein CIB84_017254 [Bambusicola thoracicus]POI20097.1 hypothetical protein CIB84_016156 [Bambusicola thoracicus]POI20098.1 hypothetical protein CIB84_016155 [Bambusicola thoracicus]
MSPRTLHCHALRTTRARSAGTRRLFSSSRTVQELRMP